MQLSLENFFCSTHSNHHKNLSNKKEIIESPQTSLFPYKGRILIIDDDFNFLNLIHRRLSKEGYIIFTANNGQLGIDKAKKLIPDIIILDIVMPDMDGWTVYKELKKIPLLSQIPIIIVTTGYYEKMAKDFGVVDFLSKPIIWKKLHVILSKYKVLIFSFSINY